MRCIEIAQKGLVRHQQTDKLQHEMYWNSGESNWLRMLAGKINYNMRCIEILDSVIECKEKY